MLRPLGILVLAVLLLCASLTSAGSPANGDFTTQGAVLFPADSSATFRALALYVGQTAGLNGTLSTPELRVTIYEAHEVAVQAGPLPVRAQKEPTSNRSFTVHHATVTLSPGTGMMGLYPSPTGTMQLTPSAEWSAVPYAASTVPSDAPLLADVPEVPAYFQKIEEAHSRLAVPGEVLYQVPGTLKLIGPHVRIDAENVTETDTGKEQTDALETTTRWVILSWDAGSLSFASASPIQIAAKPIGFTSNGPISFTPTSGEAHAGSTTYRAGGASATLEGSFQGALVSTGHSAELSFSGELRSTSLIARPGPPASFAWRAFDSLPAVVLGVAVLGGGATVTILLRKRAARSALRVVTAEERERAESYALRALDAAELRLWAQALDLVRAAREADPSEGLYPLREGVYLLALGEREAAFAAFDAAAVLIASGEAEWWAATSALSLGDADLAMRYFLAALDRREVAEWIPGDVAREAEGAGLLDEPDLHAALADAERRIEKRPKAF